MRELFVNTNISRILRLPIALLVLIFALSAGSWPVCAQDKTDSGSSACVPSDLSALVVPEGQTVLVGQATEQFGGKAGGASRTNSSEVFPASPNDLQKKEAHAVLLKEARRGNPAAMVNLGVFSLAGWGMQSNAGTGLYWLHAAADRGYGPALYDLGILYFKGCGVRQNAAEAFHFFSLGAAAGYTAAQVNLGYFYDHGLGTAQDQAAAAHWYRQAAEAGEAQAQYNLADLNLHGEGVPKDETTAFTWFQKAAVQGHTGAQIMVGSMLAAGCGVPKDLTAAYRWIFTATLQGDARGASTLKLLEGELTSVEIDQARVRARLLFAEVQTAKNR